MAPVSSVLTRSCLYIAIACMQRVVMHAACGSGRANFHFLVVLVRFIPLLLIVKAGFE